MEVLAETCADFRAEADWAAALVDGPRVLGVESLALGGVTLRVQLRTAPTRQHDVARELRRRIRLRFEQENIPLGGVWRTNMAGAPGAPAG
jgi:small conductance mechanosensitive channel